MNVPETAKGYLALEFKCTQDWRTSYNAGCKRSSGELKGVRCVGVFTGARPQRGEHGDVLPYDVFLRALWGGALLS